MRWVAGVVLFGSVALAAVALAAPQRSDIGRSRVLKSADQYLRVTVLAVRNPAAPTNHLSIPARGHKFVAIKLRLTNLCRCLYDDSPDNGAHILSSTHVAYYPTRGGIDPAIDNIGKIPPTGSRTGWMTFEVPRPTLPATFRFALDSGLAAGATWRLR
jgi:hypothetical protein